MYMANYSAVNGDFPNVAPYDRSWERDGAERVNANKSGSLKDAKSGTLDSETCFVDSVRPKPEASILHQPLELELESAMLAYTCDCGHAALV
jgi:hypothetical protein